MLDRLVERVLLPRPVARAQEVVDRLVLVLGGQPVMREQAQHLRLVAAVALLEPLGGPAVQPRPRRREQRAIGGLLDQRVPEAVLRLRPAPALLEEPEPL